MRSHHYKASEDARAVGPTACWVIARTTEAIRNGLRVRHILPLLDTRRTKHGSGLGRSRWVVGRTFAWLNQVRHLRVRYDKRTDIHEAFLSLGCAVICWRSLQKIWMTS